jgi:hypothetical protein
MADKDPKELAKDIERLQKLATLLNKNLSNINLDALKKDANLVAELLEKWEDELSASTSSVESMASSFQDVVRQIQKGNKGIRDTASSFNRLTNLAQDLQAHQRGINQLSKKQLESIGKQAEKEKLKLETAYDTLEQEKKALLEAKKINQFGPKQQEQLKKINAAQEEIKGTITGQNSAFEDLTTNARNFLDVEKQIDKQTGIIEGLIGGLGKAFPNIAGKLGLDEVQAKMREMAEENIKNQQKERDLTSQIAKQRGNLSDKQIKAGFGGKELKDMFAQKEALSASNASASGLSGKMKMLGEGAKIFGKNLTAALGPIGLIAIAVEQLIEAIKIVDSGAGDMAKSMNMTYDEALATRRELGNIATISGDAALTTKGLQETYVAIGQSLGSNAMASAETLKTFTKLREQAGYTNEQLTELNKLSLVNGKSLEDNTKEILGGAKAYSIRKGLVINEKQVLDDVTKASASLKLSLGGSADELARSAVQARAVGLNLEQAATIADSLLQFESSIENELSAELLTGKDLNFEKARTLALNNDIAGAAEEVAKQVGTSADWANMNAMAQESIAKATGLTKDQLAQSIIEREALAKIGLKDAAAAKAKYDTLRKTMTAEQAAAALGDEALAKQYEQQSVQERFNQTVEKLKEVFVQIAEPILAILSPLMDLISFVLPVINKLLQPIIGAFQVIASTVKGIIKLLSGDFSGSLASFKEIGGGYKTMLGMGGGDTTTKETTANDLISLPLTSLSHKISYMNDGASLPSSKPGYGSRTLFGPEGAIQLNNKDTVIAGTNLFDQKPEKANDMVSSPTNNAASTSKGSITVANSTAPKKETPTNPNSETNMLLSQLIKGQKEVNAVPTLRIQ